MRCPRCKSLDDWVVESRSLANGASIRRRTIGKPIGALGAFRGRMGL
ncbi:MAG: hypothetical protein ACOCYC_05055, partial [bacterium]